MLNCIHGGAGSGKQALLFERIASGSAAGKKSVLLVPEQFSMHMEKKIIESFGAPAQLYTEVLSFSRLANKILSRTGPLRLRYVDAVGKNILLRAAIQKVERCLLTFGRNAHTQGFGKVLLTTISEFKRYGITPDTLGSGLKLDEDGKLAVETTNVIEPDNPLPPSSGAVNDAMGSVAAAIYAITGLPPEE